MTIPEILKELEPDTGRFPMKAMRAAGVVVGDRLPKLCVPEKSEQEG